MFEQTSRTSFGAALTVRPSILHYRTDTCVEAGSVGLATQIPTLQLHAPSPILDLARTLDGGNIRLACLSAVEARIGAAIVYLPGHCHGDVRPR